MSSNDDIKKKFVHKKYSSIEKISNEKLISQWLLSSSLYDHKYIVQEKIHGANFCFISNGEEVKVSGRRQLLEEEKQSSFHNGWLDVKKKEEKKFLEMYKFLLENISFFFSKNEIEKFTEKTSEKSFHEKNLFVYGELFGGKFPDPDLIHNYKKPIQRGIYYSNSIEFCGFDIHFFGRKLNYYQTKILFKKFNILYSKKLKQFETLKDALEYDPNFKTTIPKLLGIKYNEDEFHKKYTNIAEGVVIRSVPSNKTIYKQIEKILLKRKEEKKNKNKTKSSTESLSTSTSSSSSSSTSCSNNCNDDIDIDIDSIFKIKFKRIIIKNKSKNFMEVVQPNKPPKDKIRKAKIQLPSFTDIINSSEILQDLSRYFNTNRLESVISKIGPIQSERMIPKFSGLLAKDAFEEYLKTNQDTWDKQVSDDDKKKFKKILPHIAKPIVIEYYSNDSN